MSSNVAGPLAPLAPPAPSPIEDAALEDFFTAFVAGISGLDNQFVRPGWQPEAPNIPTNGVNWCGLKITNQDRDAFAAVIHHPQSGMTPGYDEMRRHEVLEILASFFGPNANSIVSRFADGLQIAQNREILNLNSMGFVEAKNIVRLPTLMKEIWLDRYDFKFYIKRQIVRYYGVLDLLSAQTNVQTDQPVRTVTVISQPS